jgi:hypothetical protein
MQFGVYIEPDQRKKLAALMDAERARIRRWWKPRKQRLAEIEKPSERAAARGRYKEKFAAAVESGRLVTSRDTFITPAVIGELDQRGWHGPYDPVPVAARGPGRRWGSTDIQGRSRPGSGEGRSSTRRIGVVLPDDVGTRLERACYWENLDRVGQLERFYDTFGDSPELPDPRPGETPDELAKRYRDALRSDITTTGDILRAAIARVLAERG